jgi:hypothetical protein
VTVKNQAGAVVAGGSGTGTEVDWTWDATSAATNQRYSWAIAAPDMRGAAGTLGRPVLRLASFFRPWFKR